MDRVSHSQKAKLQEILYFMMEKERMPLEDLCDAFPMIDDPEIKEILDDFTTPETAPLNYDYLDDDCYVIIDSEAEVESTIDEIDTEMF